ncbi:MAG: hypothetical protein Q9185_001285 [Variospora sp. 1 TL-2023]
MAATAPSSTFTLPKLPVAHKDFLPYVNQKDANLLAKLLSPYNEYEAKLREAFAQHRDHASLQDPHVNAVPVFNPDQDIPRIAKREFNEKTHHQHHIIPLTAESRKPAGVPATVESIQDFQKNFSLFSESSLADLDWSNVVAAGSSVVTPLLPVPDKYNTSKKAQREYYHQHLAPSSDVDLFIWGLDEAAAFEKMKQIEASVRNAILEEVTTVRTKNAITIASHYPIRHVQIVLRLYKSVSEILSGFDVDCSCFAYDGSQVYGAPRGITAFMTQTNPIDLTRRSPSYESRLSKYAHRGFEVYWPDLDRSKVDPTIFERSFARTVGLARLLVLEQLPKPSDREDYLTQRREEKGRPSSKDIYSRSRRKLADNVKDRDPDDIPEWVYDDEISNYHSFTVPYGPKYHARKIEKLLYNRDLLLNVEWNQNKERTVNLHRHPCFIGPLESVLHDCCGFCPQTKTDEEREVAEVERKVYVAGDVEFMKDDPGRQAIGSFNPLTDDDWADMAYISNTQELCQRIADGDVTFVENWCKKNPDGVDRRDHTGRTPLHLAAQSSIPQVLKCLVENGARIVARLVDGMTALHLASARGNVDMVTALLEKSEANEAEEAEKEDRKKANKASGLQSAEEGSDDENSVERFSESSSEAETVTTEGFVKVADKKSSDEYALNGNEDAEPDVYDVNVLAWGTSVSPLHLAILGGHNEVIKTLIGTFGADALLPIKIINSYSRSCSHAIMTLLLAARLSGSTSTGVTHDLLAHGASSAQVDVQHVSAFHYLVTKKDIDLLKACIGQDGAATKSALNHIVIGCVSWESSTDTPLTTAIRTGDTKLVNFLLDAGARPVIDLNSFASTYAQMEQLICYRGSEGASKVWRTKVVQPVLLAVENDMPDIVLKLLEAGASIDTIDRDAHESVDRFKVYDKSYLKGNSLLDAVATRVEALSATMENKNEPPKPPLLLEESSYLEGAKPGSYAHWYLSRSIEAAKDIVKEWEEYRNKRMKEEADGHGKQQKLEALKSLQARFVDVHQQLQKRGAKPLDELHPEMARRKDDDKHLRADKDFVIELALRFQVTASCEILEGYEQLFQAAWEGDDEKIRELTLADWGPQKDRKPLYVATQDNGGFTPFALAMIRQHLETAKLLVGIANAQFKESDDSKSQRRYEIAGGSDYDSYNSEEDNSEEDIYSRVVDQTYTYDNIADLQNSVGSQVSASEMLGQSAAVWWFLDKPEKAARDAFGCGKANIQRAIDYSRATSEAAQSCLASSGYSYVGLGQYAMVSRDIALFRFWLQCCREASKMKQKKVDFTTVDFLAEDFLFALRRGYVEEMAEMIKISGVGLPLDALIKKSGIAQAEKPQYYQGLSIGGKKMTGWAREHGRKAYRSAMSKSTPPLFEAAMLGSLPAVEWFLSDTPLRLYMEYRDQNKDDKRLRKLAKAPGGFESVVDNLALHVAIEFIVDHTKSFEVIKYLIAAMPDAIDMPSGRDQLTPLALAFLWGRIDAAEALIEAGADQTTRDSSGKNLVHLALIHAARRTPTDLKKFKDLLALIDKRLIRSLFTERCKDGPGGLTPLGLWLAKPRSGRWSYPFSPRSQLSPDVFPILLDFGCDEALTMMDGSGQFPLHLAVKTSHTAMVKLILEHDSALLFRENAVGQTPLELAHSLYVRRCAKGNPRIFTNRYKALENREPEYFTKAAGEEDDDGDDWSDVVTRTWDVCKEMAEKAPRGRKLVSVNEAREVAKRLADKQQRESAEKKGMGDGEILKREVKEDEVDRWLERGALEIE